MPGARAKCENGYKIFPYHNAKTLSSVKKIHLIRPINSYHKLDLSLLQRGAVLSDGALLPKVVRLACTGLDEEPARAIEKDERRPA